MPNKRRFSQAQIDSFCPAGQHALRGKVISTEWNRCKLGTWLAWYLAQTLRVVPSQTLRDEIERATGIDFKFSSPNPEGDELAIAAYVRANFYSTGRRKGVK